MMKIQKSYNFSEFLTDPRADVSTGMIIGRKGRFCFVLQQPGRWRKDEKGRWIMPFAGIGGKVEKGESPIKAVHREAAEEVGAKVKILGAGKAIILMDLEKTVKIKIKPRKEKLPLIIFQNPSQDPERKPITNVLIYAGEFISKKIKPLDDPAIIEVNTKLLIDVLKKPMSLEKFKACGGRIISRIELPENSFLKPIGTAYVLGKRRKIIDSEVLSGKELQNWWKQFK